MNVRVEVVSVGTGGDELRHPVLTIELPGLVVETLAISLNEGKVLAGVQNFVVAQQVFGRVQVSNPRWNRCTSQTRGAENILPDEDVSGDPMGVLIPSTNASDSSKPRDHGGGYGR